MIHVSQFEEEHVILLTSCYNTHPFHSSLRMQKHLMENALSDSFVLYLPQKAQVIYHPVVSLNT